jgi:DNA-binding MarR family transcriptional regulator
MLAACNHRDAHPEGGSPPSSGSSVKLYGLGKVRREISRQALAELGTQGFTALAVVHSDGPMRLSDVAAQLGIDVSVASRQLSALIDAGYVARASSRRDRRAQLVEATGAGRRALEESHRRMVAVLGDVLGRWSVQELDALSEGLARLSLDFARRHDGGPVAVRASVRVTA